MYVYRLTNGELKTVPNLVVEMNMSPLEYFASPHVIEWMKFDTEEEAQNFIKENK